MLTPEQLRKLERIENRRTAYELALTRGDENYLIVYTQRHGRAGINHACRDRWQKIEAITGLELDDSRWGKRAADGATLGEWSIRFTGRAQRSAIIEGELPFIGVNADLVTTAP